MTVIINKRATRRARRLRGLVNLLLLALASWGSVHATNCAAPTTDLGVDPVEARRVLDSIAHLVVVPTTEASASAMATLASATEAHALSGLPEDRVASQEAWRAAMQPWEQVEMLQFGPAGPQTTPGGLSLREQVYSWPLTNRCSIDQGLVAQSYADPEMLAADLVNVRGLDAMEYLLFHDGPDNGCSPLSPINADGTWAALGPDELGVRRAAYAATLGALTKDEADTLAAAWDPAAGDFAGQLASAGDTSETYSTTQEALNEVIRAMFYIDLDVKDVKLGQPLGSGACRTPTCPELVESREAAASKEHIVANLQAFQQLFLGGPDAESGAGFDELLAGVGEQPLAERMIGNIEAAIAAVEAIDGSLQFAVEANTQSVADAQAAIALITDDLKGPFVTALSLRVPSEGAGDSD
ncbi:MAG: imelysin family protein [Deltaproteobacteria bacterium]|nr:imelysin family protein [Deltaproteobacteria bacterium]